MFLVSSLAVALAVGAAGPAHAAKPKLSIQNAKVKEPEPGKKATAVFNVKLSKKHTKKVSFSYRTKAGTALAGADFVTKSGKGKIKAGKRATKIKVKVKADDLAEGVETFTVKLSKVKGAKLKRGSAKARITDRPPSLDATPYQISDPLWFEPGTRVRVRDIVVTAKTPGSDRAWAGYMSSSPSFEGWPGSAIELDLSDATGPAIEPGDVIEVTGRTQANRVLAVESYKITGSEVLEAPVVTKLDLDGGLAYDDVFVELQGVTRVFAPGWEPDWLLSADIVVTGDLMGTLPDYLPGTEFTYLRGVAGTVGVPPVVRPRGLADFAYIPRLYAINFATGCVFEDSLMIAGFVQLTAPATSDTFVSVTSTDETVLTIDGGGVTVPAGQTTAPLIVTGLDAGEVTVTAHLDGVERSGPLSVQASCPA